MIESEFEMSLPYLTAQLPGSGGTLKATPEHFIVEEVPLYEAEGEGQHLYVNLTKVGLNTKDVQAMLGRLFRVDRGEVGFAGLKDKHARTTQTFSIGVRHQAAGFAEEAAARIAGELPVTVNWVRFHKNKLKPGHLLGNRFTIEVVDLPDEPAVAVERARSAAAQLMARGLPNFFGPQRMGAEGNNVRQGWAMLKGERTRHDRWLRKFLLSAYQAWLCNRYLAKRLELGAFDYLLQGDVAKKYATGGMFDVVDLAAETPRYVAREIGFTAPLYGPSMWAAKDAAGELEAEVLAAAGCTLEEFRAVHVEGTRRMGRLLLQELSVEPTADGYVTKFFLPKGAFATTVMRELMKQESGALPEGSDDE